MGIILAARLLAYTAAGVIILLILAFRGIRALVRHHREKKPLRARPAPLSAPVERK